MHNIANKHKDTDITQLIYQNINKNAASLSDSLYKQNAICFVMAFACCHWQQACEWLFVMRRQLPKKLPS